MLTKSYAVYGDSSWKLTDKLDLDAGIRWNEDDKTAHIYQNDYTSLAPTQLLPGQQLYNPATVPAGFFPDVVTDYTGNMSAGTIFATKAIIAAHPDEVRRFLAAWFDIIAYMRANKDDTVRMTSKLTGFSTNVQAKEYDVTMSMFSTDGKFDAESLATLKRSFADLKVLDWQLGHEDPLDAGEKARAVPVRTDAENPVADALGALRRT